MGSIKDKFEEVYRDYSTAGVRSSGLHEPSKAEIRDIAPLIESAIATLGLTGSIDVTFATKAELDADLAHGEGTVAVVYADPNADLNDLYIKLGGAAAGNWSLMGDSGVFHDVIEAIAEPIITAASDRSSAAAQQAAEKLSALSEAVYTSLLQRPSNASFAAGAFRSWITGTAGDRFVEGAVIDAVRAHPILVAAATKVEARVYSRAGLAWAASPNLGTDTAEWADWVSIDTEGLARGVVLDLRFPGPAPVKVDRTRTYYVAVRSLDDDDNIVNMGFGRYNPAAAGSGTDYSQIERGYYTADGTGDTVWNPGSANLLLPVHFETSIAAVKEINLPAAAGRNEPGASYSPSKRVGLRLWPGRQELSVDNSATNGHTYYTAAGLPDAPIVAARPVFAHATTATGMAIDLVAATTLDTAAGNFDTTGADWQFATFNGGNALSRVVPAAPAVQRRSFGTCDWIYLDVPERVDEAGGARLVVFLAHIKQRGNLALMGKSDGSTDYTGWRDEDRPLIMRRQAGDRCTVPTSFNSAVDISYSPIVGVEYLLESGEVLTIGGTGDSISDGAGNVGEPFGKGWGYIAARQLDKPWRHTDWVNLAWSGISMTGIRNCTLDFYTFAKAENVRVPTILFIPAMSPNSVPGSGGVAADFSSQRPLAEECVQIAQEGGSVPIIWTMIPVRNDIEDYSDGVVNADADGRIAENDAWLAEGAASSGIIVADMSAIMSGAADADGQIQPVPAATTDGIHPNETGHGLDYMGGVAVRAAKAALMVAGYAAGQVVA